ncbi:MAG: glycosyltransferase family 39 protein [Candidatus Aenigmarchaeota archaeon]|nr:glycosyltransferase family 39 protein [Candidatus Aenigmarchaeota archaeon]
MLEKFYSGCIVFFAFTGLFGIYLGYSSALTPASSLAALVLSIILSVLSVRKEKGRKLYLAPAAIFLSSLVFLVAVSMPYLVFPHGAGDFHNTARNIRLIQVSHSINPGGVQPQMAYGVGAIFYGLIGNLFVSISVLMILLQAISVLGVYYISERVLGKRAAAIAALIYGFALTNMFFIEQGYLPHLFAQFFFISSVYFYLKRRLAPLVLSNIGVASYPPYFFVYMVFVLLSLLRERRIRIMLPPIAAILVAFPETIRFVANLGAHTAAQEIPFRGLFLAKGGILLPPYLSLAVFIFAIYGVYQAFRKKEAAMLNVLFAALAFTFLVVLAFGYVFLSGISGDIRLLYLAGKVSYLSVFPLSVFAAAGIMRLVKDKRLIPGILLLYVIFTLGYAAFVLPAKANFPGNFYYATERLYGISENSTIGLDADLINNAGWVQGFPYNPMIDIPDTGYANGTVALEEAARIFQTGNRMIIYSGGVPHLVDSSGNDVIKYNDMDADYYVTRSALDKRILINEGDIFIYSTG